LSSRAQRFVDAAKSNVPEGTYAVGAGLLIAGVTAYGFQLLANHRLEKLHYAALNSLWAVVFVVTPGLFQPLEQEVARAVAHRRARGIGGGPLVKRAAVLGAVLAACSVVLALVFEHPIVHTLFHGQGLLLISLVAAIVCYFFAFITRGALSGNGRFGAYGLMHGSEGATRILACGLLFVIGSHSTGLYGLALALPPAVAVLVSLRGQHGLLTPGPTAPYSELSSALGLLLLGAVLAQSLSYAAFLAATILAKTHVQKDALSGFISAIFIARIPILLFAAVQAALLPKLAALAGAGRHNEFLSGMRRLLVIVVAVGVVGIVGSATVGPTVGKKLFDNWTLDGFNLGVLAAGSGAFILALTLNQGLIALASYTRAAAAWVVGVAVFLITLAVGNELFLRCELAYLLGSIAAAAVMAVFLFGQISRGATGDIDTLVGLIQHEPLEL
jgi:O-antigen/teichoic acid export membrane protein